MYPVKQSTALTVPFFLHDVNGDAVTGKVTGDFTKRISKNAGAFAAMTVTVTEMEGGWYSLAMDTGHTNTVGVLTVYLTVTGGKQVNLQWLVDIAGAGANLTHIDGLATSGNNATLHLKKLNIINNAGTAVVAQSTGSDGHGFTAIGQGGGAGMFLDSGATGRGLEVWATGGPAVVLEGGTNSSALEAYGYGTAAGIYVQSDGGNGSGLWVLGDGTGSGIRAEGGATGNGITCVGGATSGHGLQATVTSGNEIDADRVGNLTGNVSGSVGSVTGLAASLDTALDAHNGPDLPTGAVATDAGNSALSFKTTRTETATDYWKDALLLVTSGALVGQIKKVSAYNGSTKVITLSTALTGIPADAVTFALVNR